MAPIPLPWSSARLRLSQRCNALCLLHPTNSGCREGPHGRLAGVTLFAQGALKSDWVAAIGICNDAGLRGVAAKLIGPPVPCNAAISHPAARSIEAGWRALQHADFSG